MIPIAKPLISNEEKKAVLDVLDSGIIAQGKKVKEFEEKFASYINSKYAIATSNGTNALHIALLSSNIKKNDEVITTPFSFIATANSILYTGAKPVFVDVNEDDFNINVDLIQEKITKKTKAIMPVHLYGNPCNMKALMEIAEDKNLILIEDAAQAHGAEYNNKKIGSFSTSCFSFYPTKNITTGEGGMITTNNERIDNIARMIRDHGSNKKYYHDILGYNFRMTDINAAIGIVQLNKLDEFNKKRIENAIYLNNKLNVKGLILPKIKENTKHVFHQYTIRVTKGFNKTREDLIKILTENNIGNAIHYPVPIHKQKLYQDLEYKDKLPIAEKLANEVLSLPIHPAVSKADLEYIASIITKS